jgi:hypothetical protein
MTKEQWENLKVGDIVYSKGNHQQRQIIKVSKNDSNKTRCISLKAIRKTQFGNPLVSYAINDRANWFLEKQKMSTKCVKIDNCLVPEINQEETGAWTFNQAKEAFHYGALIVNCVSLKMMKVAKVTSIADAESFYHQSNNDKEKEFKENISKLFPSKIIVENKLYRHHAEILGSGRFRLDYGKVDEHGTFDWNDKILSSMKDTEQECIEDSWTQLTKIIESDVKRKMTNKILFKLSESEFELLKEHFQNDTTARFEIRKTNEETESSIL